MIALDYGNPKHRMFARLTIAENDICAAERALRHIQELDTTQDVFELLTTAPIILYSRPFIATRAYPAIPSKFSKFDRPTFQTFHDDIISFRNKFVAHSDSSVVTVDVMPKGMQLRGPGDALFTVEQGTTVSRKIFRREGIPLFKAVCTSQLERLEEHITSLRGVLFPNKA